MSGGFEKGLREALLEVITGFVASAILLAFINSGFIPDYYMDLFYLVNLVGTILGIVSMPYLGTSYLFGWLFGMWIMSYSGLIENWVIVLYLVVGLTVLFLKLLKKIEEL